MAFFKFRKGGDDSAATPRQPESIEAMRKRARHRLIGAGVLVLIGVIGFPLLFDTQPRPIAVDIPIEIPDRNKVKPLPLPPQRPLQAPAGAAPVNAASVAKVTPPPAPAPAAQAKAEVKPESKPESRPEPKVEARPEPKAEARAEPKADSAAKPRTVSENKPAAAADGRFVVQVGAFSDVSKAREARLKVERAGLKTYTNVADTRSGKRIRVRVGPFASRAEADKAAGKIKGLDLPAAILTL